MFCFDLLSIQCTMPSCLVPDCQHQKLSESVGISFHRFPSNVSLRRQWLTQIQNQAIPINVTPKKLKNSYVCGKHFLPSDYLRDLKHELTGSKQRNVLKKDAVPSICLTVSSVLQTDISSDNTDFYVLYCCPKCHAQFADKDTLISHINICVKKPPKHKDATTNDAINEEDKVKTDDIKTEKVKDKGTSVFPVSLLKINDACPNKMNNQSLLTVADTRSQDKTTHEATDKSSRSQPVKAEDPSIFPVSLRKANTQSEHANSDSQDSTHSQFRDENGLGFKILNVASIDDPQQDVDGFEIECEEITEDRCSDVEESDTEDFFHQASQQLFLTPQLAMSTNIDIQPQKIKQTSNESGKTNKQNKLHHPKDTKLGTIGVMSDNLQTIIGPNRIKVQQSLPLSKLTPVMTKCPSPQSVKASTSSGSANYNCEVVLVYPRKSRELSSSKTHSQRNLPHKTSPGTVLLIPQGKKSKSKANDVSGNTTSGAAKPNPKRKGTANNLLLIPVKSNKKSTASSSLSRMNRKGSFSTPASVGSSNLSPVFTPNTIPSPGLQNTSVLCQTLSTNIQIPSFAASPMSAIPAPINRPASTTNTVQNIENGQEMVRFPSPTMQNPVTTSNTPAQFSVNASGQFCFSSIKNSTNSILVRNPTSTVQVTNSPTLLNPILVQNRTSKFPVTNSRSLLNPSLVQTPTNTVPVTNSPSLLKPILVQTPTNKVPVSNSTSHLNSSVSIQNLPGAPVMTTDNLLTVTVNSSGKVCLVPAINVMAPVPSSPSGLKRQQEQASDASKPFNEPKVVPTGLSLPLILWPGNTASSNKADLPAIINPHSVIKILGYSPQSPNIKSTSCTSNNLSIANIKINPLNQHAYSTPKISLEQKGTQSANHRVSQKANRKGKKPIQEIPKIVTVEASCQTDFTEYPALIVMKTVEKESKKKLNLQKTSVEEKQGDEYKLMMNDYAEDQLESETIRRSSRIQSKPQKSYAEESDDSDDELDYGEFVVDQDKQWNKKSRVVGTQTLYEKLMADLMKDLVKPEEKVDSGEVQDEEFDEKDPDYNPNGFKKVDAVVEESEGCDNESDSDHSLEGTPEVYYLKRAENLNQTNTTRLNPRGIDLEKHSEKYTVEVTTVGGVQREIYKCIFCDAGFKVLTEDALKRHLFLHVHKRYFCPFCSHNDISGNLTEHITREHSDQLTSICDSCGKGFIDKGKLAIHKSKEHQNYRLTCDYCDNGFTFHRELVKHLCNAHNGQGLNTCPKCNKHFLDKKLFKLHCQYVKCDKKQTFLCQECGAVVASKGMLQSHISRVHKKERHYMCDLCPFTCFRQSQLTDHVGIHTLEYRHKCPHCDFRAAKKMQVRSHMRIHTGDKPYKCDQCNYRSAWNIQLRTHRGAHYSRFMIMCDPCGIAFKDERGLQLHRKKTHSGKAEEKGDNSDNEDKEEEMEFSADYNSETDEHTENVENDYKKKSNRKRLSSGNGTSSVKKSRKSNSQK